MSAAETALRVAVVSALKADPGVRAALGDPAAIYDGAPSRGRLPYLELGASDAEPIGAPEADLWRFRLTLHVWSRRSERDGLTLALGAVRSALHHRPEILQAGLGEGLRCVTAEIVYADAFSAADIRLLHGLLRLRVRLQSLH